MKIALTLVLTLVAILALFILLMGLLGVSLGVRVGDNVFVDEGLGSVSRISLALVTLSSGLYLLWRDGRRAG